MIDRSESRLIHQEMKNRQRPPAKTVTSTDLKQTAPEKKKPKRMH